MVAHAKLSASGAHRWIACPGSVEAEEGLPDKTSPFAEEGTRAHDLAERVLTAFQAGEDHSTIIDTYDDREMADHVGRYVDHVLAVEGGSHIMMVEHRVDFSDWVPEGFGTSDTIVVKGDTIHVIDLKYGKGVQVDAENNPQGMLYALGAWAETNFMFDLERVVITIVQPRLDHVSEWEIGVSDLLRWGEWVKERADEACSPGAKRTPGEDQCRWCKAKATCPALKLFTERAIMSEFDDLSLSSPDKLSDEQLREALDAKPLIEGWLSAVSDHVRERLEAGEGFDGYKLVEGRSVRQWADADSLDSDLEAVLGDKRFAPPKLLSPAQAEKALGKKRAGEIEHLIIKPSGKPTLAKEDDKRLSISITQDDFDAC